MFSSEYFVGFCHLQEVTDLHKPILVSNTALLASPEGNLSKKHCQLHLKM